jgi:hypothetical protein
MTPPTMRPPANRPRPTQPTTQPRAQRPHSRRPPRHDRRLRRQTGHPAVDGRPRPRLFPARTAADRPGPAAPPLHGQVRPGLALARHPQRAGRPQAGRLGHRQFRLRRAARHDPQTLRIGRRRANSRRLAGLAAAGWNPDGEVPFTADAESLSTALTRLAESMDLDWRAIDADTLELTTTEALAARPDLELYRREDLVARRPPRCGLPTNSLPTKQPASRSSTNSKATSAPRSSTQRRRPLRAPLRRQEPLPPRHTAASETAGIGGETRGAAGQVAWAKHPVAETFGLNPLQTG